MLSCRWSKKVTFFLILVISLIIGVKFLKFKISSVVSLIYMQFHLSFPTPITINVNNLPKITPTPLPPLFNHLYSCPVCFGYGMCPEIIKNSILFHGEWSMSHNTRILWKKGVLHAHRVLISSLLSEEWNRFDEYICRNASYSVPCDPSSAIWKTVLALDNLLSLEKFRNLNALLDLPFNQLSLSACASQKLLKEIKKSFDENFDGHFSNEESIQLLTSLIMLPGYVVMKLQAVTRMTMPIPNLQGACGRSVILEGGLKPLKSFLSESFDTRAGLAIQVLQLVEDFENVHDFLCLLPAMRRRPTMVFLFFGFLT